MLVFNEMNTNYEKVDFEKRVNVKELENQTITIKAVKKMTTQYGVKDYAVLDDGRWFYFTKPLEYLKTIKSFPFTTKIIKVKSQTSGKFYYTCEKENKFKSKSVTELINKYIVIDEIKPIETKYGNKFVIHVISESNNPDIEVETDYTSITNWEGLYKRIRNIDISEGLLLHVIEKSNETNTRKYVWFE